MANLTTISKFKSTLKRPKLLKLGLIIVVSAVFMLLATKFAPSLSILTPTDVDRMEGTLQRKSDELTKLADVWLNAKNSTQENAFKLLPQNLISKFSNEGLSIYFYDTTKLVAWSQTPNFTDKDLDSLSQKFSLYKFNDSWNLAARIKKNGKSAVVCIEIQKYYRINNNFLENRFNSLLGIPPTYILATNIKDETSHKHNLMVYFNHKPIFGLVQGNTAEYDKSIKDFFYLLSLILLLIGGWVMFLSIGFGRNTAAFFTYLLAGCGLNVWMVNAISDYSPNLLFFSPELYSSNIAPSLAVLFFYVCIFCVFCAITYYHYVEYKIVRRERMTFYAVLLSTILALTLSFCNLLVFSLVNDSTVSFGILKIAELSRYSLITYATISLAIISFILFTSLYIRLFRNLPRFKKLLILLIPLSISCLIQLLYFNDVVVFIFFCCAATTYFIFFVFVKHYSKITVGIISTIIVIWAIGASVNICIYLITKDLKNRTTFAESLYNENDPIVEASLPEISTRFQSDSTIKALIRNPAKNEDSIYNYIRSNYMNGYLNRYNLILTICPENANLYLSAEKKTTNCELYFNQFLKQSGEKVPKSSFYYIRNYPGQISYMGRMDYQINGVRNTLYIEFDLKSINNNPGYPELLIKKAFARSHNYEQYDYALYSNGSLVAKNGNYSYPSVISPPSIKAKTKQLSAHGYTHIYYRFDGSNTMVVSRAKLRVFDMASSFSYFFILLSFLGLIIFKKTKFPLDDSLTFNTFKGRITLSFIFVLTVALILTAIASLIFGIIRFDSVKQHTIKDKMKSAIPAVLNALSSPNPNVLGAELVKISNYLYVDVNIYTPGGDLYATSRPEIFYEGLQGFKISPRAYNELSIKHEGFFVDKEHIGSMGFTSSYSPVFNNEGRLICFVNLPYFLQYNDLRKELYTIAIATANIFILLLLPVILISILISNSITRPLALIRDRMRTFDLKTNPDPIPYSKNDEIGDLIAEFNKMIDQVELSAEKLAMTERDSAWREMARQIAHEIKNPLTPMKLSLQYLMMMKSKDDERWTSQFDRYAASQIEQIDSLAKIATEFSDFAKISFDEKTPIFDIRALVSEILPIFDGFPNLKIDVRMTDLESTIQIDREHMKRVIVNLLKNATQAFEKNELASISIAVERDRKTVRLSVKDTGKGIEDEIKRKIFIPNFTTKSSGSGLGLAISKNLIEAYNGKIWFESELNAGTTFFVELPYRTIK